jgi:hypothetical protein
VYICAGVLSSSPYSHRTLSPLSSRLGVFPGEEKAPVPLCPLPRREVAAPARACRARRTPQAQGACAHAEWAPASWPWLLPPVLVSCAVLFFSAAPVSDSCHFVPVLPRTRENRWIFVSRLNQFGKQVLQVVLPRARSEKHATLWLLFSTVPSSEFWCFLQSKKSPALSFCPV